jgi:hypothetical protein
MVKMSGLPIRRGRSFVPLQTATGPPAFALDRWIELTNNTRMAIVEIACPPFAPTAGISIFWVTITWGRRGCLDEYRRWSGVSI